MSWIMLIDKMLIKKVLKKKCCNLRIVGFSRDGTVFDVAEAERLYAIASFQFPKPIVFVFEGIKAERELLKYAYLWTGKNCSPLRSLNDKRVNLLIDQLEKLYEQEENTTVNKDYKLIDIG